MAKSTYVTEKNSKVFVSYVFELNKMFWRLRKGLQQLMTINDNDKSIK